MSAGTSPVPRLGPWRHERRRDGAGGGGRWVPVGTRTSGTLARVDPAGLVGPRGASWSLDWWIGAEDRWYLPSRESAVRQSLIDASPVVETRQRVPGGDLVHRVHAVQGSAELDGRELLVVELENETPVPVAVALAVRPYSVVVDGSIVSLRPHGERAVVIDRTWTLLTDRAAGRAAATVGDADAVAAVTGGVADTDWGAVDDPTGRASLALVFPLPHRASLRAAIVAGMPPEPSEGAVDRLPPAATVASGWAKQADHGLRAVLPDAALDAAFTATRRRLLLGAPDLAQASVGTDQAIVGRALALLGHHDELRPVIAALLDRQRLNGAVPDRRGSEAATGAALALLGWWWCHDRRANLLDELAGPVAKAAQHTSRRARRRRRDRSATGLLPAGPQPPEVGGPTTAYLDDWWAAAGMREAAMVLRAAGQERAAADTERSRRGLLEAVWASCASQGQPVIPVGPQRPVDDAVVAILPALAPLHVVDADGPRVADTIEHIVAERTGEDGWVRAGPTGSTASPWLTACLALHEVARGDRGALARLDWLVRAGAPLASWPGLLDGRGRGEDDRGDHPAAGALFLLLVRDLLVRERPSGDGRPGGLDVLPLVPPAWLGAAVELHDAPTSFGPFGFAVRWHGERPALLWELRPEAGREPPSITASGLAPGWSTTDPVGETLLPPPVAGAAQDAGSDVSFG